MNFPCGPPIRHVHFPYGPPSRHLHIPARRYADQGDLHAFLAARRAAASPLREETVWSVFEQAAAGLVHLHGLRIVHRDIKARACGVM